MRALMMILVLGVSGASATRADAADPDGQAALVESGRHVAHRVCSRCHAVGSTGESPDTRAPAFRTFAGQFVQLTLRRRLTEIAETGHYDMPAVSVDSDEVAGLVAYIDSFDARWRRDGELYPAR